MTDKPRDVIYSGTWEGLGKIYNIKVDSGYTTIIVQPGEDLEKRSKQVREEFARQT